MPKLKNQGNYQNFVDEIEEQDDGSGILNSVDINIKNELNKKIN